MSDKHTPGPWGWDDVPGSGIQIRGPYKGGTRLLFIEIWRQFPEREWDAEMEANARLIAAAPDLLESLQEIVAAADGAGWSQLDATLAKARAAIAKATGEQG
jgi:hypothetical protein